MKRKLPVIRIVSAFVVLLGGLALLFFCEVQIERANQVLISAIKENDNQKIILALANGASGEARDGARSLSVRDSFYRLLSHWRYRGMPPAAPLGDNHHLPALILLYQTAYSRMSALNKWPSRTPGPAPTVVQALLDHGANVNDRDGSDETPLEYAVQFSDDDTVNLLLARGADIEAKDSRGTTPLFGADARVTRILLEHGANIEAKTSFNWTPLIWAAWEQDPEVVRILLEHGANVSPNGHNGVSPLDFAKHSPRPNCHMIAILLRQYGAK